MLKQIKENINNILYFILVIILLWLTISNTVQAFKCSKMTQTELFIHIPKSFACNWEYCD